MGGELVLKVKMVKSDNDFIRPFDFCGEIANDLTMITENDEFLHICGSNDWAFLVLELLEPIKKEAKKIIEVIKQNKPNTSIKAVMLGRNDKRIMDVYFGGKGKCDRILGLPVVETKEANCIKFLVEENIGSFGNTFFEEGE